MNKPFSNDQYFRSFISYMSQSSDMSLYLMIPESEIKVLTPYDCKNGKESRTPISGPFGPSSDEQEWRDNNIAAVMNTAATEMICVILRNIY